jgi:hypothetical protein
MPGSKLAEGDLQALTVTHHDILEEFGSRDIPNLVNGLDWKALKELYQSTINEHLRIVNGQPE